ncbi:MAG: hypothetical protein NT062_25315, partial [Proteobacteria bacterium]|nr:hypothetical protein [Pseudomonadota bacterium]
MRLLHRVVSPLLIATVITGGCASSSYRISSAELVRLAATPPQTRGQAVRVDQELHDGDGPPAERVDGSTEVIFVPSINVSGNVGGSITYGPRPHPVGGGGGGIKTGGGGGGGQASSGKDAAVAIIVMAVLAMFVVIAIEGSRFDGDVALHPMHPVHLYGRDGGYTVVPLAWLDPQLASWADHGSVRSAEGPWRELRRAPLWRQGPTYALLGGQGTFESAAHDKARGSSFLIQGGYFPTDELGVLATLFLGWRQNRIDETMFESRSLIEMHYYPVKAGPFHAGLF